MNGILNNLAAGWVNNRVKKQHIALSHTAYKKEVQYEKFAFRQLIRDCFKMALGVVAAAFGLKGFLLPNSFIDGGVTGISLILTAVTGITFSVLLVAINLPFIFLGMKTVGKVFAFRSLLMIVALSLTTYYLPFPTMTNDRLLIAVFGGFFLGAGIGLAMRGGGVIDGTEVLAVYISKKTSMTIGDVILVFNLIIFSVGATVFSIETAMYAILTYLAASKTVDFVTDGIEEYIGVTIITDMSEEVRLAIIENLGRGCTLYYGKKGYAKRGVILKKTDVVYTLVTRLELSKLKAEILHIDPNAFIVMHSVKEAKGGTIKKRPLK